jgi:ketosteroid isomerase-like protein
LARPIGVLSSTVSTQGCVGRANENWESSRTENEFVHIGENVVVTRQTGYLRGRDGIEVTTHTSAVWSFRKGAVSEVVQYDEDEALEAAGLSE